MLIATVFCSTKVLEVKRNETKGRWRFTFNGNDRRLISEQ